MSAGVQHGGAAPALLAALNDLDLSEQEKVRVEAEAIRPIVRLPIFPIFEALYHSAPHQAQAQAWFAAVNMDDRMAAILLRYIGGETWARAKLRAAVEALQ